MKKRYISLILAMAMVFALLCTACGGSGTTKNNETKQPVSSGASNQADDPGKTYTFKMANLVPTDDAICTSMQYFADMLTEKSGGRIECIVYPNAEFGGSNKEQLEMVMDGTLCFTSVPGFTLAAMADGLKEFNIGDYPYLYDTLDEAYKLWDSEIGYRMLDELSETLPIYGLPAFSLGWSNISSNSKPIVTPDDLAGLKIRTSVATLYVETLKSWNITPTPIDWGEIYTALQQKTCDGMTTTTNLYITNKFYEVQKYLATTNHAPFPHYPVYNKAWYDALPDDLKTIFDECALEYVKEARRQQEEAEEAALNILSENGMEISHLTDEQKAVWAEASRKVWDEQSEVVGTEFFNEVCTFLGK